MVGEEVLFKSAKSQQDVFVLSVSDVVYDGIYWFQLNERWFQWSDHLNRMIEHPPESDLYPDRRSCQVAYQARRLALYHEGYLYSDLDWGKYAHQNQPNEGSSSASIGHKFLDKLSAVGHFVVGARRGR